MIPMPSRFPGVTFAAIAAELTRELGQRPAAYDRMIAKGSMTRAEADWQIAVAQAWREDCIRFAQAHAPIEQGLPMLNPLGLEASHQIAWSDRRAALQRELAYRARLYPGWIAKGNLLASDATHRTVCLEAMLALYEDGLDFPGTREDFAHVVAELIDRAREANQTQEALAL